MPKTENVDITLNVKDTDEGRVNVDQLKESLENFGEAGVKIADPVAKSMNRIQAVWDKASRDMATVTQRDVNSMVKNLSVLDSKVETLGSSAPKELTDALAKMEAQVREVTREFGKMDDAVKDNAANVKLAGDQWPGLQNAIEGTTGKFGALAAKIVGVSMALNEGIDLGMKFNNFIGTDMSETEKLMDGIAARVALITRGVFDSMIAAYELSKALMSGSVTEIKYALESAVDGFKANMSNVSDAVSMSTAEFVKAHPEVIKHGSALDTNTDAANRNTAAHKAGAAAVKSWWEQNLEASEAQRKHLDALAAVTKAIGEQRKAIEESKAAELDAEHGIIRRTSDMEYFERDIQRATDALIEQANEVATLTEKYGANDPMTLGAIERQKQLEHSLDTANQQFQTAKGDVDRYTEAQQLARKEIEDHQRKLDNLIAKQKEAANSTAAFGTSAQNAAKSASALTGPVSSVAAVLKDTATNAPGAAKGIAAVGDAAGAAATGLQAFGDLTGPQAVLKVLQAINAELVAMPGNTVKAREHLEELAAVAGDGDE